MIYLSYQKVTELKSTCNAVQAVSSICNAITLISWVDKYQSKNSRNQIRRDRLKSGSSRRIPKKSRKLRDSSDSFIATLAET